MYRVLLVIGFLFLGLTGLSGCATNKIFLHTYEIDEAEIEKIVDDLTRQDFEVIISDRAPPQMQLGSFIIYPRDSDDNAPLAKILNVIGEYGYYTQLIAKNRVKNHTYTKKNHIGLYLINPNIDWLEIKNQLDLGFSLSLSDVNFTSTGCHSAYVLRLENEENGTIRQTIPEVEQGLRINWQQLDEQLILTHQKTEYRYFLEKEYIRKGNHNELLLTLSPGNHIALNLHEPFACIFESRTSLVD